MRGVLIVCASILVPAAALVRAVSSAEPPRIAPVGLSGVPAAVSTTSVLVATGEPLVPPTSNETPLEVGSSVPDPTGVGSSENDYSLLIVDAAPGQYGSAEWGRCTQYEPLIEALAPEGGWDVDRFSKIMWRESRCDPTARSTTKDSGLLQINDRWIEPLAAQFGVFDPYDPVDNIRAAAVLCTESRRANRPCERPWGGTEQ